MDLKNTPGPKRLIRKKKHRLACAALLIPAIFVSFTTSFADTFEQRQTIALNGISAMGLSGDGNHKAKSGIYIAMARYAKGDIAGGTEMATWVYNHPAGAAMFLVMAGMDCYLRYNKHLPAEVKTKFKKYVRSFAPYQGGSSENHYTMFNVGGYLASQEWNDPENLAVTRAYLMKKMRWVCQYGIKEHDSPTYHVFHVNSFLSLYDHARDPEVKAAARVTLEVLLADWAHEWQRGAWAASTLRTYGDVLDHSGLSAATGWLYFGGSHTPSWGDGCGAMSCISLFRLPDIISSIATDRSTPYLYRSSDDQIPVVDGNTRFEGTRVNYPGGFRKTTWMGKRYGIFCQYDGNGRLGWSDQMMRGGMCWPGGKIIFTPQNSLDYQMLVYDGCLAGAGKISESKSGVQSRGTHGGWTFLQGGNNVFIARRSTGDNFAYVTAELDQYSGMDAFKSAVAQKTSFSVSNGSTILKTLNGHTLEIKYDGRAFDAFNGLDTDRQKINGERVVYADWPRMKSPWAHASVGGNQLELVYGNNSRTYHFDDWTITSGKPTALRLTSAQSAATRPFHGTTRRFTLDGRTLQMQEVVHQSQLVIQKSVSGHVYSLPWSFSRK